MRPAVDRLPDVERPDAPGPPRPVSPPLTEADRGSLLRGVLIVVLFTVSLLGALRIAALPAGQLAFNFAVDDAFYYLVPARHLLAGHQYGLDGETRSNGVQPLWAIMTIGLCALLPSEGADVRALVLLSGVLWFAAGGVLYVTLRRFDPWLALVAAAGFVLTGFGGRLAFQGMENGVHALLCALLVWTGVRYLRMSDAEGSHHDRPGFYLGLGLLLALVTLARIDSAMLALIVGGMVLAGVVRPGGDGRFRWNLRGACWLALPCILLVGGVLLLSQVYFGQAFPISGSVKLYLQSSRPPLHGGTVGSILYHLKMVYKITTIPIAENFEHLRWIVFGAAHPPHQYRLRFSILLVGGGAILGWRFWREPRQWGRPGPWGWYAAGLTVFCAAHLLVYAIGMSHFTDYGTWYFAPQALGLWILYAVLIAALGRLLTRLRLVLTSGSQHASAAAAPGTGLAVLVVAFMLTVAGFPIWSLGNENKQVPIYHIAGRWLESHLPAGTRVGCFSSGIVSHAASSQRVVNLDGLMNSRDYFENYLKKDRISNYLHDRGVAYFCDYGSRSTWQGGHYWGLDLTRMQLVRWWPMWDDLSYAVWRLRPPGSPPVDILDAAEGPCDRFSQIQFAAEIHARYRVVPEEQLAGVLAEAGSADLRVITSIIDPPSRRLRHVLAPGEPSPQTRVTPDQCDIQTRVHVVFGGLVELLGFDLPDRVVDRGQRLVITRYWRLASTNLEDPDVSFELWLHPARPQDLDSVPAPQRIVHQTRSCYGTCPLREWRMGEVVAETYSLTIPPDTPPGPYPVMLVLWDSSNRWLLPERAGATPSSPGLLLANIEIR